MTTKTAREKKWERKMAREDEMNIDSEFSSRDSLLSAPGATKVTKGRIPEMRQKPQRTKDERSSKEFIQPGKPHYYSRKEINPIVYIPEKLRDVEIREMKDIVEGLGQTKQKGIKQKNNF